MSKNLSNDVQENRTDFHPRRPSPKSRVEDEPWESQFYRRRIIRSRSDVRFVFPSAPKSDGRWSEFLGRRPINPHPRSRRRPSRNIVRRDGVKVRSNVVGNTTWTDAIANPTPTRRTLGRFISEIPSARRSWGDSVTGEVRRRLGIMKLLEPPFFGESA
ncbi:hypothetical protein K0M31_009238 [Melipona bicolor]|uniref:Uncharacterized protein n=1 Tax=Melipona bicolor TaxID=60889 RepID=A0AA40FP59_9HYME|nr:hypothetical protein K0M31_009238 [Melipona bicolor]